MNEAKIKVYGFIDNNNDNLKIDTNINNRNTLPEFEI
jgi:hypothetical protein